MKNGILEHFGILGQKWGIRRYQNPDGTLTPAGKERHGTLTAEGKKDILKRASLYLDLGESQIKNRGSTVNIFQNK